MSTCCDNLFYAQKLQKQTHDKGVKLRRYIPSDKVWLKSKFIKTKWKQKLETKFFGLFQILHPVTKQAYKLELFNKRRVHNIFHILLLEQDFIRKTQVEKIWLELKVGNSKEYKVEIIQDSNVYTQETKGHSQGLY